MLNESVDQSAQDFGATILPVQYFTPVGDRNLNEGEYRLLLAVLGDAVRSYLENMNRRSRQQRLMFAEVRSWFFPRGKQQGLFAFESICDLLGIEPQVFRSRLNSISVRDLPKHRRHAHPRQTRRRLRR